MLFLSCYNIFSNEMFITIIGLDIIWIYFCKWVKCLYQSNVRNNRPRNILYWPSDILNGKVEEINELYLISLFLMLVLNTNIISTQRKGCLDRWKAGQWERPGCHSAKKGAISRTKALPLTVLFVRKNAFQIKMSKAMHAKCRDGS